MAKPKRTSFFKTKLENRPGALLAVAQQLKAKNVGLLALWGFSTQTGEARMYCVPKDPDKFRAFASAAGMTVEEGSGFLLRGPDKTGALITSLEMVARAGVNLVALQAVAAAGNYGAFVWVEPEDVEKTGKALGAA